jgi:hypothetical protein
LRFSGLVLENIFMVFLGSSCRETAKNAIKKKSLGKDERKKGIFSQLFRPKVFDIDFPQKVFDGVFELPLLRNAQKRHKKNLKKNRKKQKGTYLPDLLAICQIHPRFIFFSLSAPCDAAAFGTCQITAKNFQWARGFCRSSSWDVQSSGGKIT